MNSLVSRENDSFLPKENFSFGGKYNIDGKLHINFDLGLSKQYLYINLRKGTKIPKLLKNTYIRREFFRFCFLLQAAEKQNAQDYRPKLYKILLLSP